MRLILAVVLLLAGQVFAPFAHAHAGLISVSPADTAFSTAPPAIVLTFSEPVSPLVFRLLGPKGETLPLDTVQAQGADVRINLPSLPDAGIYALSWRVVSADGHPIGDTRLLTIGAATAVATAKGAAPEPGSGSSAGMESVHLLPEATADASWRTAGIWLSRLAVYLTLFIGLGAIAFQALAACGRRCAASVSASASRATAFIPNHPATAAREVIAAPWGAPLLYAGVAAVLIYAGFAGLDALDAPLADVFRPAIWKAVAGTSIGLSTILALLAFACAIAASRLMAHAFARSSGAAPAQPSGLALESSSAAGQLMALIAWMLAAMSLAATGHASAAPPTWLARPVVWLHTASVMFWIGALYPLLRAVRRGGQADLQMLGYFSRCIPWAIALIVGSGAVLIWLQLGGPVSWWKTPYGWVLIAKLLIVAALLLLGAWNRYRLTDGALRGDPEVLRQLGRTISVEVLAAILIFAIVALWRFTPPPRAIMAPAHTMQPQDSSAPAHGGAASTPASGIPAQGSNAPPPLVVQSQGSSGAVTASVTLSMPTNPAAGQLDIRLQGRDGKPLDVQAVTVLLTSEGAELEPIRHEALKTGPGNWRVETLLLPALPRWTLQIDALISDFERVSLEMPLELPRK